jgi:hypothetical protein
LLYRILTDPSFNTVVNPRTGRKEVSETSKRQLKNVYEKSDDENKPLKQDTFLKKTSVNKLTDANDHLSTEDTDSDVQSQFSWNENSSDSDTSSEETAIDNDVILFFRFKKKKTCAIVFFFILVVWLGFRRRKYSEGMLTHFT